MRSLAMILNRRLPVETEVDHERALQAQSVVAVARWLGEQKVLICLRNKWKITFPLVFVE